MRVEEESAALPLLFQQSVRLLVDAYGTDAADNEADRTGNDVSALYCVRILVQKDSYFYQLIVKLYHFRSTG